MVKIWVKTIINLRIHADFIYTSQYRLTNETFFQMVRSICEQADIPTPLILSTHISHFKQFGQCKFKKTDFVETVFFDELVLENVTE